MSPLEQFWPIIVVAAGVIVWSIRQEGIIRVNAQRADDKHAEVMRLLTEHYATKNEVSLLKGAIDSLSPQLQDTKSSVLRIESKVDAFLVAAVQQQPSKTIRRE